LKERPPRPTGGWRYLRFHGTTGRYAGRYGAAGLRPVAADLLAWSRGGRDAWVYFNNDTAGHAVEDARAMLAELGEARPSPDHSSSSIRSGSSMHSFTFTRNETASRPSTRR
jgi:uncharacterized protein YecE (DUF72 family)